MSLTSRLEHEPGEGEIGGWDLAGEQRASRRRDYEGGDVAKSICLTCEG